MNMSSGFFSLVFLLNRGEGGQGVGHLQLQLATNGLAALLLRGFKRATGLSIWMAIGVDVPLSSQETNPRESGSQGILAAVSEIGLPEDY